MWWKERWPWLFKGKEKNIFLCGVPSLESKVCFDPLSYPLIIPFSCSLTYLSAAIISILVYFPPSPSFTLTRTTHIYTLVHTHTRVDFRFILAAFIGGPCLLCFLAFVWPASIKSWWLNKGPRLRLTRLRKSNYLEKSKKSWGEEK